MTQAQSFACPNCKGPIEYSSGMGKTVTCRFCSTSVVVPKDLRTAEHPVVPRNMMQASQQPIVIDATPITRGTGGSMIGGCLGLVITGIVILSVIGIAIAASGGALVAALIPGMSSSDTGATTDGGGIPDVAASLMPIISQIAPTSMPTDVPFAAITLEFGQEGTGAGFFQDARHIAVDESGTIFVGQYIGGRVQVFDPTGRFLTQWSVDTETPLRGFSSTRDGIVYTVYGGDIYRYQGATGTLLGQVNDASRTWFDDLRITADGGFVATEGSSEDDILVYDSQGVLKLEIPNAVSTASGEFGENAERIAIDGVGNIYALPVFENAVYKFGPDGRFLDKFTGPSEEVNGVEFTSPYDIAVDSQSRLYLSDFAGIIVLDSNGNYLRTIDDGGAIIYGLNFDYAGNLWAAANTKVLKFTIYE